MSTVEVTVTVPGDPVPKARARVVNGRAFTPAKTVTGENQVQAAWVAATGGRRAPHDGPVVLHLDFHFTIPASWSKKRRQAVSDGSVPHRSRPDLDNLAKLVMDGLNGLAWTDDAQIAHLTATKRYADSGRTVVRIRFINPETVG